VKAVVLSLLLATAQRLSGAGAIIQYTAKLFCISGSSVSPNTASIITGIFQLVGSGITIFLIDKVGRRKLLLVSSSVVVACLAMLTMYFYFLNKGTYYTLRIVCSSVLLWRDEKVFYFYERVEGQPDYQEEKSYISFAHENIILLFKPHNFLVVTR